MITQRRLKYYVVLILPLLWSCEPDAPADPAATASHEIEYSLSPYVPQQYIDTPVLWQQPLLPEATLAYFKLKEGFRIGLFAAEPMVVNPVSFTFDTKGRCWVLESLDYPHGNEEGAFFSRIKILTDTDGDGRADEVRVFADSLRMATGILPANGGVFVTQAPYLLFLSDTDGDDKADNRRVILDGFRTYDTHAGPSNLRYGPDNRLWGAIGYAGFSGTVGQENVDLFPGLFSLSFAGTELRQEAIFSNNTWGLGFNFAGEVFGSTANREHAVHLGIPARYYALLSDYAYNGARAINTHEKLTTLRRQLRQVDHHGGFTSAISFTPYTAASFPAAYRDSVAFVCEPTAGIIHCARLTPSGDGYLELDEGNLLASPDEWFAPVHTAVGPDGALWVADWYDFTIQHNPIPTGFELGAGNAYQTPLRDKDRGRIYRIWHEDTEPVIRPFSEEMSADSLFERLADPNLFWRTQAQRLLVERKDPRTGTLLRKMLERLPEVSSPQLVHGLRVADGLDLWGSFPLELRNKVFDLLRHRDFAVVKAVIDFLPPERVVVERMAAAGIFQHADPRIRLAAVLFAAESPGNPELVQTLLGLARRADTYHNFYLPQAVLLGLLHQGQLTRQALALTKNQATEEQPRGLAAGWQEADFEDADWPELASGRLLERQDIAELSTFDGKVWCRAQVRLPAGVAEQPAQIALGPIDNSDVTWINGKQVGRTIDRYDKYRFYPVPAGTLRAGRNTISIQLEDLRGEGGLMGQAHEMYLTVGRDTFYLPNRWRYRIESRVSELRVESWEGMYATLRDLLTSADQ